MSVRLRPGGAARGDRAARAPGGRGKNSAGIRQPGLYPLCDGRVLTVRARAGWHGRVRQDFCEVYYRLNCIGARIQRLGPGDATAARALWRALKAGLRQRDALEDRWSPRGVIAEPVLSRGLVADLRFTFPDIDALGEPRIGLAGTSSAAMIVLAGGLPSGDAGAEGVC